jgi:8-oxo-dGTP diphosphatase
MTNEPRVGVALIITKNDQVLLVKRKGVHGEGTWSTPGGHLEFGESPEECARREAEEEIGVMVRDVQFKALTNDIFTGSGKHYITIWMQSTYASGEPRINAPYEVAEVDWFDWNALPQSLFLPLQNLLAGRCYC